jgi:hypothetical protein
LPVPVPRGVTGTPWLVASFQNADQLVLGLRRDDQIAGDMVEPLLQDRRVPVEVATAFCWTIFSLSSTF